MSVFSELRDQLVTDLAPLGVPVHPTWPVQVDPPCVFVAPAPGGQWVTPGDTFGGFTVAIDVVIMVEHSAVELALAGLENFVELALRNTMDWQLTGVDPPAPTAVTEGGAEYLAAVLHISKSVYLS